MYVQCRWDDATCLKFFPKACTLSIAAACVGASKDKIEQMIVMWNEFGRTYRQG